MPRVEPLAASEMTAEQTALAATIAGSRGGVLGGPFALWLRVPEIAERVVALSERLRKNSGFEKRLVELMVLLIVGRYNAGYAWNAHARQAREEGIPSAVIEAIRARGVPAFARPDEQLIYDIFAELNDTRALSDATYARGIASFGLDLMIELITTAGLYTTIALMLTVFDPPKNSFERDS